MMHQSARDLRPRRSDPTLLLAFLLPVFAWAPMTYPGYFVFRSGFLPVFNLVDRLAHLVDPGWMPTVGTGFDLLGGQGSFPYLLAAVPVVLGASPVDAVKWIFALSFVAGSVGACVWTRRRLLEGWPALVAASVYVFSPIWLTAVYSGGAFAQAVLLGLLPWVLWAADAAAAGRRAPVPLLSLFVAACLWTQLASGFAFLVMVLVYLLILRRTGGVPPRALARVGVWLAVGLVLGVLGLLPVILRSGLGAPNPLQASEWLILICPWLALFGGWVAHRLGAMLPEPGDSGRAPLFAALISLVLLGVYSNLQPAASAGPIPPAPLAIFGENEIALLSVETEGTPGPGEKVALDVAWQALRPLEHDYTVFFHVVAADEQRYGQLDTMPQVGTLPTRQWEPGEVVRDRYEAVLSQDAPIDSHYRYWLGWYLGETGQRLPLSQVLLQGPGLSLGQNDKFIVTP